jgi:bifunctional non-homologous end joining protein LigD
MDKPLHARTRLLESALANTGKAIRHSAPVRADPDDTVRAAKENHLEGVIAKRSDSAYEAGKRSGAWVKYRVSPGQELVIGGYLPAGATFDALLVGYYEGKRLLFIAKIRNGFVPATRREVMTRMRPLATGVCPFANLPEAKSARRGLALTAEVMKMCRWVKPKLVAQIEFTEWTDKDHLRHARFLALREDKDAIEVTHESVAV